MPISFGAVQHAALQCGTDTQYQLGAAFLGQRRPAGDTIGFVLGHDRQDIAVGNRLIIEKNALKLVPKGDGGAGVVPGGIRRLRAVGWSEYQQGNFHGMTCAETKSPGVAGASCMTFALSVIAREGGEQVQHVYEQVVDVQVQGHGGANVVGLAAIDDAAGVEQDQAGHDHHDRRGDRQ